MAAISIIVPVYNAEAYIKDTIISVQKQTYTNWELILVIDGSPDNSAKICKELALNDSRIKVYEQKNSGVNRARFNGLKQSTSDFVTFLDSDDLLPIYSIETMLYEINKGYDIVKGIVSINKELFSNNCEKDIHRIDLTKQEFLKKIFLGDLDPYICGSCFRKSLFDENIFLLCENNVISIGEDWIINLYIGKKIQKACIINKNTYIYRENPNGVMNTSIMSQSYSLKINNIINSIIDYNTIEWNYLKELRSAMQVKCLFIWERGYSHKEYNEVKKFIHKYGINELRSRCDNRHLYFIDYEPIFYIYSRIYSIIKKLLKDRKYRKIID